MQNIEQDLKDFLKNKTNPQKSTPVDVIFDSVEKTDDIGFRPRVKENLGYIVCTVVFNSYGEVLMIQESKKERQRGKWYLPAGKVDPGESLEGALTRVVRAESGLRIIANTLLSAECCTGQWYRFTFGGTITGGSIKTKSHADKNSIMAKWFPVKYVVHQQGIQLRSTDILPLINIGMARREKITTFTNTMPCIKAHKELLYRLVLMQAQETDGHERLRVLVSKKEGVHHFPTAEINPFDSWVLMAMYRILKDAFGRDDIRTKTNGLLTIEHCGKPIHRNDGICLTALVTILDFNELITLKDYEWMSIEDSELEDDIKERVLNDCANVSLMDIY